MLVIFITVTQTIMRDYKIFNCIDLRVISRL